MKGLKVAVVILTIITLGLGGFVIYKEFINKEEPVNVTEYETKITNLENENKKLREDIDNIETDCPEVTPNPYEQYAGTYIHLNKEEYDRISKEGCSSDTNVEDATSLKVTLNNDGTFDYFDNLACGSGDSGSGKYVIYNNVITAYNEECLNAAKQHGELQNCPIVLTYKIDNGTLKHSAFSGTDMAEYSMTKK